MSDNGQYLSGREYWNATIVMTPAVQSLHPASSMTAPYKGSPLDITFMVPCYNHEATILETLATIYEAMGVVEKSYEILIIDDGSQDRTVELIREHIAQVPHLNVLLRINHKRKGDVQNYIDGAFSGSGKYYRMVYPDNSEAVETMVDILRALGEADVVVPYYISMRQKGNGDKSVFGSYTVLFNLFSGHRISRYDGLHVHLRYNVMRWRPVTMGAAFQADLLCQLLDLGFTYKQVPCRAVPDRMPLSPYQRTRAKLSIMHTLLELVIRRFSRKIHE